MWFGQQFCVTTFENNFSKCGEDDYGHTSPVNSLPLDNELIKHVFIKFWLSGRYFYFVPGSQ